MVQDLLSAVALLMVLEGILPFLSPRTMRRLMFSVVQQNDKALRVTGLVTMALGLVLLYLVRNG